MTDDRPPRMNGSDNESSRRNTPEPTPNGLRAFETLWRFLEDDDWHPARMGDQYIYHVQFSGNNGHQNCYAMIRPDIEQFVFYAVAPIKAPEEVRGAVAEFITRANYGLRIGNFEFDYADGEIRFKSSFDFENVDLSPEMLRTAIYAAVQTLDHYMPSLMRVMYGGRTPVEAILEIKKED